MFRRIKLQLSIGTGSPPIKGETTAQYLLSQMYEKGRGVSRDIVQAYMWTTLAAVYDPFFENGLEIYSNQMTSKQIAEVQRLAREWTAAHPKK